MSRYSRGRIASMQSPQYQKGSQEFSDVNILPAFGDQMMQALQLTFCICVLCSALETF